MICGPQGTYSPDHLNQRLLDAGDNHEKPSLLPPMLYELAEWGYSVPAFWRLQNAIKTFQPDILYERCNLFFDAGRWAAQRAGLPYLLEVNAPLSIERARHGDLFWRRFAQRQEHQTWRSADHLLPVSTPLAEKLKAAGVSAEKITVIPNGVTAQQCQPASGEAVRARYHLGQALVVGFTGFVRDWHGVDWAINWLAQPEGREAFLLIVGDGPAIPSLRQQAANLDVADRVIITGTVQRDALPDHIAAFDIALQPRVTAYASPLKLFEYMAQSRAIIAPDQPNITDVLRHEENALLFAPQDPSAFYAALCALARNREARHTLGQKAHRALLQKNFTWQENANRVTRIATQLVRA